MGTIFGTSSDGVRLAYEVHGIGPALLLLHGFSNDRSLWTKHGWIAHLQRAFTVITMDMRGCGDSDAPLAPDAYQVAASCGRQRGRRRLPREPVSPVGVVLRGNARPPSGCAFAAPPTCGGCWDLLWSSLYRRLRATSTGRNRAASGTRTVAGRPLVARYRTAGHPMPHVGVHGHGGWQRGRTTATAAGGH